MFKQINLSLILGLALSSLIFGYAVSNIFLSILILLGVYFLFKNKKFIFQSEGIPIFCFYLYGVLTLFWTVNYEITIQYLIKLIPLLVLPLFLFQYPSFSKRTGYKIIRIFSISLILYFILCLLRSCFMYFNEGDSSIFFYHPLVGLFKNHAIYISLFVSFCTLSLINSKEIQKYDYIIISVLILFLLFLASKNIIVSTIIIQTIFFLKNKGSNKFNLFIVIIFTIITLLVCFSNNPLKMRFLEEFKNLNFVHIFTADNFKEYYWTGTNLRLFQLRMGYEIVENYNAYISGVGLGAAQGVLNEYYINYGVPHYKSYNFHNQYMQTFVETGMIGLILLLSIIFFGLYKAYINKNIPLLIFTLLMFFLFFTEVVFARQKGILFFIMVYTIFMKMNRQNS